MLAIKEGLLEYTCCVTSVSDALLMDTSYKSKGSGNDQIISDDERTFTVDRLEKALRRVVDIFGDAYVPSSLYIDNEGVCGFSLAYTDRVISDALHKTEALDADIKEYVIAFIKNEWYALMGDFSEKEIGSGALWKAANNLFSYKYVPSYVIEEV